MALFGPYTGDSSSSEAYAIGVHWKEKLGYKVVEGSGFYGHFFGGQTWELPLCPSCRQPLQQILTFDLNDPALLELKVGGLSELPLVSCLNCSYCWEPQAFRLIVPENKVQIVDQWDDQDWRMDEEDRLPVPLPQTSMKLERMTEDDLPIDEDCFELALERFGREQICRILGAPLYLTDPIDRQCPGCGSEMIYAAQIIEDDYTQKPPLISVVDFKLGELVLYFSLCPSCLILKTEMQGT
ncbi:hypothetical protein QWJ34_26445 [Saccharibacillus sp. CPCC 101409]|uniref:hypothetical protein n=1 Tax=Saccharibacillus sp. CPCC 101409 TaxID=3058041 RepID=UPI00267167E3|nr:hypothetical protein [Saccharibacillus sp. CPCC 101409]MDO3413320.1 hypothetical protein [Saccharibacillus sp. CPCC 101409]